MMNVQTQEEQLQRTRFWKKLRIVLFLLLLGVVVAILFPVFARAEQNRRQRIWATDVLVANIIEVSKTEQGALLKIKPRRQRGFNVRLKGSENLEIATDYNEPFVLPVKRNTLFSLDFRHSGASYCVSSISSEGVLIEILATGLWNMPNRTVMLPWSDPNLKNAGA